LRTTRESQASCRFQYLTRSNCVPNTNGRNIACKCQIESITVNADGFPTIISVSEAANIKQPVVYVGLIDGGPVLKVGISKRGLAARWNGILGVMDKSVWHRLRPNEKRDGERLIEHATGRNLSIWLKQPIRVQIPYATDFFEGDFCGRHAEEMFLDSYYQPVFGQRI
jgi:hypothetical protein